MNKTDKSKIFHHVELIKPLQKKFIIWCYLQGLHWQEVFSAEAKSFFRAMLLLDFQPFLNTYSNQFNCKHIEINESSAENVMLKWEENLFLGYGQWQNTFYFTCHLKRNVISKYSKLEYQWDAQRHIILQGCPPWRNNKIFINSRCSIKFQ